MAQQGSLPLTYSGDIIDSVLLGHTGGDVLSVPSPVLALLATTDWLILRAGSRHNAHQLSV